MNAARTAQPLGSARNSNVGALNAASDWFAVNEAVRGDVGSTHRTAWSQGGVGVLRRLS